MKKPDETVTKMIHAAALKAAMDRPGITVRVYQSDNLMWVETTGKEPTIDAEGKFAVLVAAFCFFPSGEEVEEQPKAPIWVAHTSKPTGFNFLVGPFDSDAAATAWWGSTGLGQNGHTMWVRKLLTPEDYK